MVRLEATRENKTFAERITTLTNYISPLKQMWPYYWLKAAAVRHPQVALWQLRYFSLVGRWSDTRPFDDIYDRGNAIAAISKLVSSNDAWTMLISLQTSGTVSLISDITATANHLPDMTMPTSLWQDRTPFPLSKAITAVTEAADWRYLFVSEKQAPLRFVMIPSDHVRYIVQDHIRRAVQDDLDDRGLNDFGQFTSTRLGLGYGGLEPDCSISDFFYQFDLPLAVRIERGIPDRSAGTLLLTIYCRYPLKLEGLKVNVGERSLPDAEVLPVSIEVPSAEERWSVGEVVVPYDCGKVWLKFDNLLKALSYEIPVPTTEDQATELLGHIYSMASSNKGKEKWAKHLLDEKDANFEIALLNAIARFGIPVLFAGQLQAGGTATPGFDLAALNHAQRRAVLISAKGYTNNPSQEDCQKLLDAVDAVQEILGDWYVTGILACHATNNKLGLARKRTDLRVWSREDLELLFQADKREAIESLIWNPPDTPMILEQALRSIKGY